MRRFAAVVLGSVALVIAGCSERPAVNGPPPIGFEQALLITSDFSSGALSTVDLDTRKVAVNVAPVHSDATLRVFANLAYVVNRLGRDNIQIIDPGAGFATKLQFSTGNGSNPQDIVLFSPTRAYISRLGSAEVLIVDPRSGASYGTVSLAPLADGDGLPEMARMTGFGPFVFVACQRLTNFQAANPSVVAVIDTRADTLVDVDAGTPGTQGIPLMGRNPVTDILYDSVTGTLLVGCVGAYGVLDGGVERIDPVAFTNLGVVITETALGGDLGDIAWNGPDHSYAIVSDASFNSSLVSWSATSGTTIGTIYSPSGFSLADCELNQRGELYVCDNGFGTHGVRVYDAGPDTLLAGPLDVGLPPVKVAFRESRRP